ncbi:hypothetical protein Sjap_015646 [Stephania japonica]|uniref:Uncharacterized protein n=1 Tax=Stephania japonica TaxID=461633 RepID=A0AAP0IJI7_9MAGN
MSSSSGQPQFRYTQTPSKVLHLRNLPWECAEEELVELCKPFGKIVNTKCNVGANRNQAFVEFVDLNQAISMVSYYASSSEPAQIRGKTVYIQYSNRQEIVNNKSSGDVAGNVLLVTIEGVEAGDVSIDVHSFAAEGFLIPYVIASYLKSLQVFSAFGFVHKIATFEKAAGFQTRQLQALIQYSDAETASSARNALDGRSIPRQVPLYLLPEHVATCHLRISFSAHTDLNIKFQSHRSRDYTNPYLPVNPSAIEGTLQTTLGPDGCKKEPESNVLLASIENMQYAVTVDVLHTVFSAFGTVQKIAMFEKNGGMQALIQYPDVSTAAVAKEALEGHSIYDGGFCKLHLSYSRHTDLIVKAQNDRSRDYTIPDPSLIPMQQAPGVPGSVGGWQIPQSAPMYPGNDFAPGVQVQPPGGQTPSWDPSMQAGRLTFAQVPSTFPGQTYGPPSNGANFPAYSSPADFVVIRKLQCFHVHDFTVKCSIATSESAVQLTDNGVDRFDDRTMEQTDDRVDNRSTPESTAGRIRSGDLETSIWLCELECIKFVQTWPHGSHAASGEWPMGPHEPYWQTNSSYSPPVSRRWEHRLQIEGIPYGSHSGIQLFGSSSSSNSKESEASARNDHFLNHPGSDDADSYFSSPSDSFHNQQWTPRPMKGVNIDDYVSGTIRVVLASFNAFYSSELRQKILQMAPYAMYYLVIDSASGPLGVSPPMEGTSGLVHGAGSTSSRSDNSDYEAITKGSTHSNRNFSRCSFISKPIHPISFINQITEREDRGIETSAATPRREALQCSSDNSSIDFTDVSEQLDSESTAPYHEPEGSKCGLCNRLLSQRSPWSSRRIVRSGDMPVTGVLSCRHVFHADCLDQTTPKMQRHDPPCPVCAKLEENALEQPLISRLRNGLPRLKPFMEEGPSTVRPWGCAQVGDCVEGALHASSSMMLLNRSRLRKHLSLKANSSKELPDKLRKSGSFSPRVFHEKSVQPEAVESSKLSAGPALKRW